MRRCATASPSGPDSLPNTRPSAPASPPSASPRRRPAKATSSAASGRSAASPRRCADSKWATPSGSAVPTATRFPIEDFYGKNLVFVAGGIALPPLRTVIWNCLDLREKFGDITIVYGARTEADLVYKRELAEWEERDDVRLVKTVDPGGNGPDWNGRVGFVPTILEEAAPAAENTIALVCGPPIMIKFTLPVLERLGFTDDSIYTTLENRMKCGLGKCGRCNVGQCLRLQGRPRLHRRPGESHAAGVLIPDVYVITKGGRQRSPFHFRHG